MIIWVEVVKQNLPCRRFEMKKKKIREIGLHCASLRHNITMLSYYDIILSLIPLHTMGSEAVAEAVGTGAKTSHVA